MNKILITNNGLKELERSISIMKNNLSSATLWRGMSVPESGEEKDWKKKIMQLEKIRNSIIRVKPKEQNQEVRIGNGVIIEFDNGETFEFILEGYHLGSTANRVSLYAPLGQAVFRAKKGEKKFLVYTQKWSGERRKMGILRVKEILTPTEAERKFGR